MSSKFISFNPGVMTSDGDLQFILKASSAFGGMTIVDAWAVNGAAADAGTSSVLYLVNYGTSGTVVGSTIATLPSGTAAPWAADTPKQFAITAAQAFLDSGEWLVLKKSQQGADSDLNAQACVMIEYCDGVIVQG